MDSRSGEEQFSNKEHGGAWITFPFISVGVVGCGVAIFGLLANLIVYLINEFHIKSIDAAQISNVVNGCASLSPVVGAMLADSFGCFPVISISYCISLLGSVVLTLTAALPSLTPKLYENGPSKLQLGVLYTALTLAIIGIGGTRYNLATMGANQFRKTEEQAIFFNWFFFLLYGSAAIGSTALVYVQDNVSWGWGFAICLAANFIGLAIFLAGIKFYRREKPKRSPFLRLARVPVAAIRKRKAPLSTNAQDYHHHHKPKLPQTLPTSKFRFLNHAAVKREGDINSDGSIENAWSLCSVQEVEDLKRVIKILPLFSTSIFLSTPIAMQGSLQILQALAMDRHLGAHFKIPAGSISVLTLLTVVIFIPLIDRFLLPTWQKLIGTPATPLQRVGLGNVLTALSMVASAAVESRRLKVAHHSQQSNGGMMALWLLPQLVLVGLGEAFQFPGQVALYYQEFPASLKGTSTGLVSLSIAIAYYLGTAMTDLIRRVTGWLPDDINDGRLDNVYWVLVVMGVLNFGYFLVCAVFYNYQQIDDSDD